MPRLGGTRPDRPERVGLALLRGFLAGGLGFALYAVVPVAEGPLRDRDGVFLALGVTVLTTLVAAAAARERRAEGSTATGARIENLVAIVLWAVAFFALVYFRLSLAPDQIPGIATRLDAMYFTATTLTTVGFGDIVAVGQAARAVVLVQMAFNITVLGLAVRLLLLSVQRRRPAR